MWLAAAILAFGSLMLACSESKPPPPPLKGLHDDRKISDMLGQRMLTCDDGSQVDVDFLTDGLRMVVTWLPGRQPETLLARKTGDEFRGPKTRALIVGRSIAFERDKTPIRICHAGR